MMISSRTSFISILPEKWSCCIKRSGPEGRSPTGAL
jgi:hypothetical protein